MAVDLESAKRHLNITTDIDDTLIEAQIAAAKDWLDRQLGYSVATKYANAVPPALDQCVLLMTAHFYANREATLVGVSATPLPFGVIDIVNDYRSWSWGEADV